MSDIKVDSITNAAGDGSPAFPLGITGNSDGSSAAAGRVGEIVSQNHTAGYTITSSYSTVTGMSISLTAGVWMIIVNASLDYGTNGSYNLSGIKGNARVYNVTDATSVGDAIVLGARPRPGSEISGSSYGDLSMTVLAELSDTKTIEFQAFNGNTSNNSITFRLGSFDGLDHQSSIVAYRIR